MKRIKLLMLVLFLLPLAIDIPQLYAETVSWTAPDKWKDGTTVSAEDKAQYVYYLRLWKTSIPTVLTYFGETRNGVTTWSDNVMVKANYWASRPDSGVTGWVPIKAGDNVTISVSTSWEPPGGPNSDSWTTDPKAPGSFASWIILGGVVPPPPAPTATLSASSTSIVKGTCTTLTWATANATSIAIDQGVGTVSASGTKSVCPIINTTYSLTAVGQGGSKVATVAIVVTVPPVVTPGCTPPTGVTIK